MSDSSQEYSIDEYSIAVIGMAGQFPGASNIEQYWSMLENGREGISAFKNDELEASPKGMDIDDPRHVKSQGVIQDIEYFDAPFFNIPPQEAKWLDPQQRLFLEKCWLALENAGYSPTKYPEEISVYGGTNLNSYLLTRIDALGRDDSPDQFQVMMSNDKDFLTTRVGYKLGLRGECLSIQTSCSTSLVSIHMACQSLLSGQSSMALAGGASVRIPHHVGYVYQKGMIASPDGHCRPFDVKAEGTVPGSGVGVVVLKRLEDAINDRDNIYAVIRSSAINNDGHDKVGFTAPSVSGQTNVIKKALLMANISAESIGFIEAHGTATPLGDPIEVEALTRAFRESTTERNYCALGSVKSNIGHLDAAAGVAGFIKSVLSIYHGKIPPTLHYSQPNQALNLDESPFFVNNRTVDWPTLSEDKTRRAGVSSFGIGGTNAHVILEEYVEMTSAQDTANETSKKPYHFPISAATPTATINTIKKLSQHITDKSDLNLANLSFTLTAGRKEFQYRACVSSSNLSDLKTKLTDITSEQITRSSSLSAAFLFCGQGVSELTGIAKSLYSEEPMFRSIIEECQSIIQSDFSFDLVTILLGDDPSNQQPSILLPTIFSLQYALAKNLIHSGIRPSYLIGHSFGEYAAACIAGIFNLRDGLKISRERGLLLETLPRGAMLSVNLSTEELQPLLQTGATLAIHNAPNSCVISGSVDAIENMQSVFSERQIDYKRLPVAYAFHSEVIDNISAKFKEIMSSVSLKQANIPLISNLTGQILQSNDVQGADYWVSQMRNPVLFFEGMQLLVSKNVNTFVEVGPNNSLIPLIRHFTRKHQDINLVHSLPRKTERGLKPQPFSSTIAGLWCKGLNINWENNFNASTRRIPLPGYPFDKQKFWVEQSYSAPPKKETSVISTIENSDEVKLDVETLGSTETHFIDRESSSNPYAEPANETEQQIVEIWQQVLGINGIGSLDNFYDLGGDSLLAVQMHNRLKAKKSVPIELEELMFLENPQDIARFIDQSIDRSINTSLFEITALSEEQRAEALPLSFSQEGLWSAEQSRPSAAYNLPFSIKIKGNFKLDVFRKTLSLLIERHQVLRAYFPEEDGLPVQKTLANSEPSITMHDLLVLSEDIKQQKLSQHIDTQARLHFDLLTGPMFRVDIFLLDENELAILFNLHHIIADAWSMRIFARDISMIYTSIEQNIDLNLPQLQIQYADYAYWQRHTVSEQTIDLQLNYWRKQLANLPREFDFGQDYPAPAKSSGKGSRVSFEFPEKLTDELTKLARQSKVSLFTVLLAAFSALLHRRSNQESIIVGVPIAGRNKTELESLIGCFINTLVIRTEFKKNLKFAELLKQTNHTLADAYKHQEIPFDKVVKACRRNGDFQQQALVTALFDFQNIPASAPLALSELEVEPLVAELETAKLDLIIDMWERDGILAGSVEYNTDRYKEKTIKQIMQDFSQLLGVFSSDSDFKVGAPTLASKQQRLQRSAQLKSKQHRFRTIRPTSIDIDG